MPVSFLLSCRHATTSTNPFRPPALFAVPEKGDDDPSPTAASAAASAMMKKREDLPRHVAVQAENATKLIFTAFRISSMDMRTTMTLRPSDDSDHADDEERETQEQVMSDRKHRCLGPFLGHDDSSNHGHQQQNRRNFKRQQITIRTGCALRFRN